MKNTNFNLRFKFQSQVKEEFALIWAQKKRKIVKWMGNPVPT